MDEALPVVIFQPALAHYRVPFFRALARQKGMSLSVGYGCVPSLANVAPDGFKAFKTREWKVTIFGERLVWDWSHLGLFLWARPRVVVISWDFHFVSTWLVLLLARLRGTKVILWGHGFSKRPRRWRSAIRELLGKLADGVILYSERPARELIAKGWKRERVFVVHNSLDATESAAAEREWMAKPDWLESFRRAEGIAGRRVILFVSRLMPDNRLDLLVRASRILARDYADLVVAVIGEGPHRAYLSALVEREGLAAHYIFKGAVYREKDLAPWFLSARVMCYPSNVGLSLLHAFGYGLPVVTSDNPEKHNPEFEALAHMRNGLTYKDGDASDLARVLAIALDDDDLIQRLSREARETVSETFCMSRMVSEFHHALLATVA